VFIQHKYDDNNSENKKVMAKFYELFDSPTYVCVNDRAVTVRSPHDMIRTVNFSNGSVYFGMIQYSLTTA